MQDIEKVERKNGRDLGVGCTDSLCNRTTKWANAYFTNSRDFIKAM